MDEEDEAFLKKYNTTATSATRLSEDEFEKIMWQYESTVDEHWPHLDLVNKIKTFNNITNPSALKLSFQILTYPAKIKSFAVITIMILMIQFRILHKYLRTMLSIISYRRNPEQMNVYISIGKHGE